MGTDGTQIEEQAQQHEETNNIKQGHSYFGICCDMRRAVAIVNLLSILNFLVQTIIVIGLTRYAKKSESESDGSDVFLKLEKAMTGVIVMAFLGWLVSIYAFYGAYKYKWIPLAMQIVYTSIYWLASNVMQSKASRSVEEYRHNWFNWVATLVVSLLFIYPHAMLITELRAGIMTPETYPREKQSCCCV